MSLSSIPDSYKINDFYTYKFQSGPELKAAPGPKFDVKRRNVPLWKNLNQRPIVYLSSEQLKNLPHSLKTHQLFLDFLKACSLMIHPNDLPQSISQEERSQHHFDSKQAIDQLQKTAKLGFAPAQHILSLCYMNGRGVVEDEAKAVKWDRKAAEQGYAPAQNELGVCYMNGQGVQKNEAEGVKWIRKAAEQRYAPAQNNLGVCYLYSQGVEKNEAVKWLREAAEQGLATAQFNLANCYSVGRGIEKNKEAARDLYIQAYVQGIMPALVRYCQITKQPVTNLRHLLDPKNSAQFVNSIKAPTPISARGPVIRGSLSSKPLGFVQLVQ